MTKTTRALSGAAKDAFLDDVVRSALGQDHAAREKLLQELVKAVASLRVRVEAERAGAVAAELEASFSLPITAHDASPAEFDPFSPNVVVVLRRDGREAAVAALHAIGQRELLLRLAKEQQLGLPENAGSVAEICEGIVAAAERRVANRRAAAS